MLVVTNVTFFLKVIIIVCSCIRFVFEKSRKKSLLRPLNVHTFMG